VTGERSTARLDMLNLESSEQLLSTGPRYRSFIPAHLLCTSNAHPRPSGMILWSAQADTD
jgi:hypothetical protein